MEANFTKLRTFLSADDAHLSAAALEQHGIPCEVVGDTLATAFSFYGVAVSKVDLHVPEDRSQEAALVLKEFDQQKFDRRHDRWGMDARTGWACPECSEVNEQNFDICWACGATRPDAPEKAFLPDETPEQPVPSEGPAADALEELSDSPYRVAPGSRDNVVTLPDPVVKDLQQRAVRSFYLGLACLPVLLYSIYLSGRLVGTGYATVKIWACFVASVVILMLSPLLLSLLR